MVLSGLRILVVDDYEALRFLKARILRKAGAEVLEADCGKEARDILAEQAVDLLLLDIHLPDMPATEITRGLRANPATSGVPVILTSASDLDQELREGEMFLQEPVEAAQLVSAIRTLLGRS